MNKMENQIAMLLTEQPMPMEVLQDKEKLIEFVDTNYKDWFCEIKENGERTLISVKNNKITAVRNRNNLPTFHLYPELQEVIFPNMQEALFDCEIILADEKGKSHFYNEYDENKKLIQAGIQIRSRSIKDENTIKKYPVTIVIFDVLKINGETMVNKPYSERYNKLLQIQESDRVKIAKNYNFAELWDRVIAENLEGSVLKNPNSLYELGKRTKNQIKIKNYKSGIVRVEKTEQNDKGVKVFGFLVDDESIKVEVQIPNTQNFNIGEQIKIKWLDMIGKKLIQPVRA